MANFLEESSGNKSGMRLMCLLSLVASFVCAVGTLFKMVDSQTGITLTAMFLGGALGGKTAQKFAETKV